MDYYKNITYLPQYIYLHLQMSKTEKGMFWICYYRQETPLFVQPAVEEKRGTVIKIIVTIMLVIIMTVIHSLKLYWRNIAWIQHHRSIYDKRSGGGRDDHLHRWTRPEERQAAPPSLQLQLPTPNAAQLKTCTRNHVINRILKMNASKFSPTWNNKIPRVKFR